MQSSPCHVAIVMDGNGRWAKKRYLPRVMGHRAGARVVRTIVEHAARRGIAVLTLFAFSRENRARPPEEVSDLMSLFMDSLERYAKELHEQHVRLRLIGERAQLLPALQDRMAAVEALTAHNTGMTLVVAIDYSGRWDIVEAARALVKQAVEGNLTPEAVTEARFAAELSLADLPPPDLLVRTSGEQRMSNFLLWQLAYTELYFTEALWPDFTPAMLDEALDFFATRERRFGRI